MHAPGRQYPLYLLLLLLTNSAIAYSHKRGSGSASILSEMIYWEHDVGPGKLTRCRGQLQLHTIAARHYRGTDHCSTAPHSAAPVSIAQHSTAQHSTAQHSTAQQSTAQHCAAQHSTAQHSTAQLRTAEHANMHLLCALKHASSKWVFVFVCFMPFFTPYSPFFSLR
jgi:hypothetical protein